MPCNFLYSFQIHVSFFQILKLAAFLSSVHNLALINYCSSLKEYFFENVNERFIFVLR